VIRIRNRDVTRAHLEERLRERLESPPFVPPLPTGEGARG
jgi:hypothetical protein